MLLLKKIGCWSPISITNLAFHNQLVHVFMKYVFFEFYLNLALNKLIINSDKFNSFTL